MIKVFGLRFGGGNPTYAGSPTFTRWVQLPDGQTLTSPFPYSLGTVPGIYYFTAALTTFAISFICDGGAFLTDSQRYIDGILDPLVMVDQNVGLPWDSVGSTSADPSTLFGLAKRNQEVQEGAASFSKTGGTWNVFARGATLLLFQRAFVNSASTVTKT